MDMPSWWKKDLPVLTSGTLAEEFENITKAGELFRSGSADSGLSIESRADACSDSG